MLPPSPPPTPAFTRAGESASADLDEDEIPWAYKLDALWTLFWKDPDLLEADCAIGECTQSSSEHTRDHTIRPHPSQRGRSVSRRVWRG